MPSITSETYFRKDNSCSLDINLNLNGFIRIIFHLTYVKLHTHAVNVCKTKLEFFGCLLHECYYKNAQICVLLRTVANEVCVRQLMFPFQVIMSEQSE